MNRTDFEFELPSGRIAQEPVSPRDQSKLLVIKPDGALEHRRFCNVGEYLQSGDVIVRNATKVFPARLRGKKRSGGKVELLLLRPESENRWQALVRGTTRNSTEFVFPDGLTARLEERLTNGEWMLRFSRNSIRAYLDQHGEMPLPPYIKRTGTRPHDTDRYQTVYARQEGAVAAPTAGFHFTDELLKRLQKKGVQVVDITLHVGWGTFRPLRVDRVEDHPMLPESYVVTEDAAVHLTQARAEDRRIIAVGTTAVRTLESIYQGEMRRYHAGSGETNLFIYPGYRFQALDALLTNFHLPDSTPLLLACAFYADKLSWRGAQRQSNLSDAGQIASLPRVARNDMKDYPFVLRQAYAAAIAQDYRFYSYGDAMLIL